MKILNRVGLSDIVAGFVYIGMFLIFCMRTSIHSVLGLPYSLPYFVFVVLLFFLLMSLWFLIRYLNNNYGQTSPEAFGFLFVIHLIMASLIALEWSVRIFDVSGINRYHELKEILRESRVQDPKLFFRGRSHWKHRGKTLLFETDKNGFRMISSPPVDDSREVVFLGDEITSGLGVTASKIFPSIVRDIGTSTGIPIRPRLMAVPGLHTTQEHGLLSTIPEQSPRPDALILTYVNNDILGERPFEEGGISFSLKGILSQFRIWDFLWRVWADNYENNSMREKDFFFLKSKGVGAKASLKSLEKIHSWCAERGIGMIVVHYGLYGGNEDEGVNRLLHETLDPLNVPIVKPVNGRKNGYRSFAVNWFIRYPGEEGHRRIAKALAPVLFSMLKKR